jgi:hypothetical protein
MGIMMCVHTGTDNGTHGVNMGSIKSILAGVHASNIKGILRGVLTGSIKVILTGVCMRNSMSILGESI